MEKYYRVTQDNFMWKKGAILTDQSKGQYIGIEDVWDTTPVNEKEYISARIVEHSNNAAYFERVYPDTLKGSLYRTKDQLVDMYEKAFV